MLLSDFINQHHYQPVQSLLVSCIIQGRLEEAANTVIGFFLSLSPFPWDFSEALMSL